MRSCTQIVSPMVREMLAGELEEVDGWVGPLLHASEGVWTTKVTKVTKGDERRER